MKVYIYARFSGGSSTTAQKTMLRRYAAQNGFTVVRESSDTSKKSLSKKRVRRIGGLK